MGLPGNLLILNLKKIKFDSDMKIKTMVNSSTEAIFLSLSMLFKKEQLSGEN
jgi:hypothetical protein